MASSPLFFGPKRLRNLLKGRGGTLTVKIRILSLREIARCPIQSLLPSHYNDDGSCKCDEKGR